MAGTYQAGTAVRHLRQKSAETVDRVRPWPSAVDRSPVTRAGLIVNPRSGKSSGKGLALAEKLRGDAGVSIRILGRFEDLDRFIRELAAEGVSDLFISSGDGTIHAIQTALAEEQPFARLPRLALLPHGTTNMTAADLGFRYRSLDAQADFIRKLVPSDLRSRPTIRAANPRDGKPRHGMFLGCGAVAHGTLYCQEAFNKKGVKGNFATFATLGSAVAKSLFTRFDPTDESRLDRPFDIAVEADGKAVSSGQQLLMMSTTLEKLVMNTRPFWGGHTAPIRVTIIPFPLPSVPRWILPVMYGGENRTSPPRTQSFCANHLSLRTPSIYVMDGEFFDGPETGSLEAEVGPTFTFVCG